MNEPIRTRSRPPMPPQVWPPGSAVFKAGTCIGSWDKTEDRDGFLGRTLKTPAGWQVWLYAKGVYSLKGVVPDHATAMSLFSKS
jgi:hypothetical protein